MKTTVEEVNPEWTMKRHWILRKEGEKEWISYKYTKEEILEDQVRVENGLNPKPFYFSNAQVGDRVYSYEDQKFGKIWEIYGDDYKLPIRVIYDDSTQLPGSGCEGTWKNKEGSSYEGMGQTLFYKKPIFKELIKNEDSPYFKNIKVGDKVYSMYFKMWGEFRIMEEKKYPLYVVFKDDNRTCSDNFNLDGTNWTGKAQWLFYSKPEIIEE